MLDTTGKVIRAFWGKSFDEMKKEMEETIENSMKKVLPQCYKDNGNDSSNTPTNDPGNSNGSGSDSGSDSKVSFNADTHSADALAQTQPVEEYKFTAVTPNENDLTSIDTIALDVPDCDSVLYPSMDAACIPIS